MSNLLHGEMISAFVLSNDKNNTCNSGMFTWNLSTKSMTFSNSHLSYQALIWTLIGINSDGDIAWANPRLQPLTAKMLQAVVVMKEGLVPRKVAVHT